MAPYIKEKALKQKIKKTQKNKREVVATKVKAVHKQIEDVKRIIDETTSNKKENTKEHQELTCDLDQQQSFDSLADILSEKTLNSIHRVGLKIMTPVQATCIPIFLKGRHIRATAKTGSGKTLAFLIPVIELIQKLGFKPRKGTGVIILSPTRELTMQTFGVLTELAGDFSQTIDIITGGNDPKAEEKRLVKGVNVIVSTPQRLIYHLENSNGFVVKNCFCVVLDEADRLIDGFEEELKQIFKHLPDYRQTVMFSATKNEKLDNLAAIATANRNSTYTDVNIDEDEEMATVSTLKQFFIVYPTEKKLCLLLSFLKLAKAKKLMVFFNCCEAVEFYHAFFNYTQFPVMCMHGNQLRSKRAAVYRQFSKATSGTLFCTDIAARGWDIPAVDWIIQYDPPEDPIAYIHRVGRTARGGAFGQSLLFITEEEIKFIEHLRTAKINVTKNDIVWSIVDKTVESDFQDKLEMAVTKYYHIKAKCALRGYLRAYKNHKLKDSFDVHQLNLKEIAKCFGFRKIPQLRDILKKSSKNKRKETEQDEEQF